MKHTFRFQVTVNKSHEMQVFKRAEHFSRIESRINLWKTFPRPGLQCSEKLAAITILHDKIQIILTLEAVI